MMPFFLQQVWQSNFLNKTHQSDKTSSLFPRFCCMWHWLSFNNKTRKRKKLKICGYHFHFKDCCKRILSNDFKKRMPWNIYSLKNSAIKVHRRELLWALLRFDKLTLYRSIVSQKFQSDLHICDDRTKWSARY